MFSSFLSNCVIVKHSFDKYSKPKRKSIKNKNSILLSWSFQESEYGQKLESLIKILSLCWRYDGGWKKVWIWEDCLQNLEKIIMKILTPTISYSLSWYQV